MKQLIARRGIWSVTLLIVAMLCLIVALIFFIGRPRVNAVFSGVAALALIGSVVFNRELRSRP